MQHSFLTIMMALLLPHAAITNYSTQPGINTPTKSNGKNLTSKQTQPADKGKPSGKKHREFDHHSYEIIDTTHFITYYMAKPVEKIPNKGVMMMGKYYFSKTANDAIFELSIDNLKKVFPQLHHFHYALEEEFRSDKQLMDYDPYLKEYKLKYIFSQSLNE